MSLKTMYYRARMLPGLRGILERVYRRRFARERIDHNAYCGIYPDYATALAHAPTTLPTGFDNEAGAKMYLSRTRYVLACDYPAMFWLDRLLAEGCESIFDLGGNIGIKYYAFRRYLHYPQQLRWTVCELPGIASAGAEWAAEHDEWRQIRFTSERNDVAGHDILFASGVLQYLPWTLGDLLEGLRQPPRHLLINVLPLHDRFSFFTVQNSARLYAPYRISAQPDFVQAIIARGYVLRDHWDQPDRSCDIPFHPGHTVEKYHGFLFSRST